MNIVDLNMGKERKEKLEDLMANNAKLWKENDILKEKAQMFNKIMVEMEIQLLFQIRWWIGLWTLKIQLFDVNFVNKQGIYNIYVKHEFI
jgi:hypothetical protein